MLRTLIAARQTKYHQAHFRRIYSSATRQNTN